MKYKNNDKLFIYDDALLVEWNDINQALEDNKDISIIGDGYKYANPEKNEDASFATWEEIKAAGWDKYVKNPPHA